MCFGFKGAQRHLDSGGEGVGLPFHPIGGISLIIFYAADHLTFDFGGTAII